MANFSQVGFIDFLVRPLFDVWYSFSPTQFTSECLSNIKLNREAWVQYQQNGKYRLDDVPEEFAYIHTENILQVKFDNIAFTATHLMPASRSTSVIDEKPSRLYTLSTEDNSMNSLDSIQYTIGKGSEEILIQHVDISVSASGK